MQNYDNSPPLKVEAQQLGFFETPVVYSKLKDSENLIADLRTAIQIRKAEDAGINRSNIGGWHSDTNMMDWGGSAARKLADTAIKVCKRMTTFLESDVESYQWNTRMWANVTSSGGLNQAHAHPGNLWAAVLYLDMGLNENKSEEVGGSFFIEDPRFPMAAMHNTALRLRGMDGKPQQYEIEFNLEPGNLIIFPAWLRHGVRQYTGDSERISIAMNIDANKK